MATIDLKEGVQTSEIKPACEKQNPGRKRPGL